MDKSVPQVELENYLLRRTKIQALEKQLRVAKAEEFLHLKICPWLKNMEGQLEKQEADFLAQHPQDPLQLLVQGGLSLEHAREFLELEQADKEKKKQEAAQKLKKKLEKKQKAQQDQEQKMD
jgi:hypothetical protein